MTTHIRVSSAWTPAPLVFLFGLTNSPVGTARMLGVKTPLVSDMVYSDEPQLERQKCAQNGVEKSLQETAKRNIVRNTAKAVPKGGRGVRIQKYDVTRRQRWQEVQEEKQLGNCGELLRAAAVEKKCCGAVESARLSRSERRWSELGCRQFPAFGTGPLFKSSA